MAEKIKTETLIGTITVDKTTNKPVFVHKVKDGDTFKDVTRELAVPLSDKEFEYLKKLGKGNRVILRVEEDKEFRHIYPKDTNISKKYFDFYGYKDKNDKDRIAMKTMTSVTCDQKKVTESLKNNPYANVFACIGIEVEKDGKKEYVKIPNGMFSPRRKGLSAEDYMKEIHKRGKYLYDKFVSLGVKDARFVTFMSVCETTGVSLESNAGKIISQHFMKKDDKIGYGYVPMNKYLDKNQQEVFGLAGVPTTLFMCKSPMDKQVREASEEERSQFKFTELENMIASERAAREEEYQKQQDQNSAQAEIVYSDYSGDEESEDASVDMSEDADFSMNNDDEDDNPFGSPSF